MLEYCFHKFNAERNESIQPRNATQNVNSFFQELELNYLKFEWNATSFSWCLFFFFFFFFSFHFIRCIQRHSMPNDTWKIFSRIWSEFVPYNPENGFETVRRQFFSVIFQISFHLLPMQWIFFSKKLPSIFEWTVKRGKNWCSFRWATGWECMGYDLAVFLR